MVSTPSWLSLLAKLKHEGSVFPRQSVTIVSRVPVSWK
jgi:hypothetical protein